MIVQRQWQKAERPAIEAENQRSQATGELQRRLYGTPPEFTDAIPAYEKLRDGSLSALPRYHWYSDAAVYVFITGITEDGQTVLTPRKLSALNRQPRDRSRLLGLPTRFRLAPRVAKAVPIDSPGRLRWISLVISEGVRWAATGGGRRSPGW